MKNLSNLSKKISMHGLDIGNATCKSDSKIIFDSRITTVQPLTKAPKMIYDNVPYWMGVGNLDTTYRKVDKEHYVKMLFALLGMSTNTTHNNICLGLPLGQFKDRQALIDLVMKDNEKIIEIDGKEKPLIIDEVEVMPEGVSTLPDEEECIVVDIGGLTTDAALVVNERGVRKIENPISIASGTINLQSDLINKINTKYSLDLKLNDAERILRNGLLLDGKLEDINFAMEMYKEFTKDLVNQLRLNYNVRTNYISLTGGGAQTFYDNLHTILGEGVKLQEEPIYANARNFKELAQSIWEGDEISE